MTCNIGRVKLKQDKSIPALVVPLLLLTAACNQHTPPSTHLASLAEVSIEALRARTYVSRIQLESARHDYSFLASYDSDGNRIYTRIDLPVAPAPTGGYPVLIFVHGWYGREGAPTYDFLYRPDSLSERYISRYLDAGFVVISPALRGHGTVNGIAAEGIEFLDAWDNGSYISPMFYTIDVLNLLEGIMTLEDIDWPAKEQVEKVRVDRSRINIAGYSQGGDVALTALAVSGENSTIINTLAAGSIWSGCFGTRFEQAATYGPMASTLQAFMSGDGSWSGSATGPDGSINPDFIFAYPSDWIGTVDPGSAEWAWQADTWSTPTVAEALQNKFSEMYEAVNRQVGDIHNARFEIVASESGKTTIRHDPRVETGMSGIGAYEFEEYLTEPVHFHHSDQDYYSIPRWNSGLAERINAAGGHGVDFVYPQNNHSLLASNYDWFSKGEVVEGFSYMIDRDIRLFNDPASSGGVQAEDLVSIQSLRRYAGAVKNEFHREYDRELLEGIARSVVSFRADGLKQYALVLKPTGTMPENGWPVLIMNHGYHPNPPDNGRVADGSTDRPGDYYRGVPLAFAKEGFLVVVPDFRGHNISEGIDYTKRTNAHRWYTRDVIAAFRALGSLPEADPSQVFMWGHSMGGNMTVRALLALGSEIRGAAIWSTASDPADTQPDPALGELEVPLNIHHSIEDPATSFQWSQTLNDLLDEAGHSANFYPYESRNHLFAGENLSKAIGRDMEFFDSLMENQD